jgi:hypothetical protein
MPYSLLWKNTGVMIIFSGVITPMEIMQGNNEICSDPRFEHIRYQLCDFLQTGKVMASEFDAKMIGAMDKSSSRWNNKIKVVCVAKDPDIIKLIEVYAKMLENTEWDVIIMDNMEEALAFVNE